MDLASTTAAYAKVNCNANLVAGWMRVADMLDNQGEVVLAGDVRYFATHLPPVLTDRERLAQEFIQHLKTLYPAARLEEPTRQRDLERSR